MYLVLSRLGLLGGGAILGFAKQIVLLFLCWSVDGVDFGLPILKGVLAGSCKLVHC